MRSSAQQPQRHPGPVAVVVAGGDPIDPDVRASLPPEAFVIAADSGADHAAALGLPVDLLVGDLDSISAAGRLAAEDAGVPLDLHPTAKDKTDFELALDAAVERGFGRVVVVGGHGGRVDHLLANLLLLASPAYAGIEIEAQFGPRLGRVYVVHGQQARSFAGDPGQLVTLLALGGPARGVTTEGLEYPLRRGELRPGSSLGVSNRLVRGVGRVTLEKGTLVVVLPGPERV